MEEKERKIIEDLDFMSWALYQYLEEYGKQDINISINKIAEKIKIKADKIKRLLKKLKDHGFIKIFIPDNYEEDCRIYLEGKKENLEPDEEAFNWLRDKWLNHTAGAISYNILQRIQFITAKYKLEDIQRVWRMMKQNNMMRISYLEEQLCRPVAEKTKIKNTRR